MPDIKDVFVNQAYLKVIESSANTLTFNQLLTNVSIHEKVGWVISRIDYEFLMAPANFAAEGDGIKFGISVSDQLAAVSQEYSGVLDYNSFYRRDYGTAASTIIDKNPRTKSFADLPGGGLLVPPNPLFIFVEGVALTSPITVEARMFYTQRSLKVEDFWELVEMRRMIGV